jgi:hypothetical protein
MEGSGGKVWHVQSPGILSLIQFSTFPPSAPGQHGSAPSICACSDFLPGKLVSPVIMENLDPHVSGLLFFLTFHTQWVQENLWLGCPRFLCAKNLADCF